MSVISVTHSTCLVYKILTFIFKIPRLYYIVHGQSANFDQWNIHFSSFTGASNARNDGMSVISVTHSMRLVYKITTVRKLDFSESKAYSLQMYDIFTTTSM